jgi:hypothetical protein
MTGPDPFVLRRVSFYAGLSRMEHTAQIPLRYVGIHYRQFLIERLRDCIRVLIIYVGIVKSTYLNDSCTKSQLIVLCQGGRKVTKSSTKP